MCGHVCEHQTKSRPQKELEKCCSCCVGISVADAGSGVAAPAQPAEQSLPALQQLFTAYKHAKFAGLHRIRLCEPVDSCLLTK